jgi:GT2 family glycosyltransferase
MREPSIPKAMNYALRVAKCDVVLFLDDDVELTSELVAEHAREYENSGISCVAGRVVQPWEKGMGEAAVNSADSGRADSFRFSSERRCPVKHFMGGNFSIRRQIALDLGGFDENFVKVAYRFEAEFAGRLLNSGSRIQFQPTASIIHLKASTGGTRSFGHHLTSMGPGHAVGRYYYLLTVEKTRHRIWQFIFGPLLSIRTKHHLMRPWWIPITLCAEVSGMTWALWLFAKGRKHVDFGILIYRSH